MNLGRGVVVERQRKRLGIGCLLCTESMKYSKDMEFLEMGDWNLLGFAWIAQLRNKKKKEKKKQGYFL